MEVKVSHSFESAKNGGSYKINITPVKGINISEETKVIQKLASDETCTHAFKLKENGRNKTYRVDNSGNRTNLKRYNNSVIEININSRDPMNPDGTEGNRPLFVGVVHEIFHGEEINDGTDDISDSDLYPTETGQDAEINRGKAVNKLSKS